jgi:hypothetical protein
VLSVLALLPDCAPEVGLCCASANAVVSASVDTNNLKDFFIPVSPRFWWIFGFGKQFLRCNTKDKGARKQARPDQTCHSFNCTFSATGKEAQRFSASTSIGLSMSWGPLCLATGRVAGWQQAHSLKWHRHA